MIKVIKRDWKPESELWAISNARFGAALKQETVMVCDPNGYGLFKVRPDGAIEEFMVRELRIQMIFHVADQAVVPGPRQDQALAFIRKHINPTINVQRFKRS